MNGPEIELRLMVCATSRRYRQTKSVQALKETDRFMRPIRARVRAIGASVRAICGSTTGQLYRGQWVLGTGLGLGSRGGAKPRTVTMAVRTTLVSRALALQSLWTDG